MLPPVIMTARTVVVTSCCGCGKVSEVAADKSTRNISGLTRLDSTAISADRSTFISLLQLRVAWEVNEDTVPLAAADDSGATVLYSNEATESDLQSSSDSNDARSLPIRS